MEWLSGLFRNFGELFRWFFILQPWEQALRIRAGRRVRKFTGGMHFRIPFVDTVFRQNTRTRISGVKASNVTTTDGRTITVAGAIEYEILDIAPLYERLHNAEETIGQNVQSILAAYIINHAFADCTPEKIMGHVSETMNLTQWGLSRGRFLLTDFAVVRTYRVITGEVHKWFDDALDTQMKDNGDRPAARYG